MHSYATATAFSARTSLTAAVTSRWGTLGTTSTSLPSVARKSGRSRRRATLRRRRMSGGIGTTSTATTKRPPRSSNRFAGAAQPATPRDRSHHKRADRGTESNLGTKGNKQSRAVGEKGNKDDGARYQMKVSKHYD